MTYLDSEAADLDGDGKLDALLVLETQPTDSGEEIEERTRSLRILIRQGDGTLKLEKQNDRIVYCSTCGGVMGDPYAGITAKTKGFEVTNAGGSNWRWSYTYAFGYSRRDKTWQLVKVTTESYHSSAPEESTKVRTQRPPKDFGKIAFADFDPEHYEGVGPK